MDNDQNILGGKKKQKYSLVEVECSNADEPVQRGKKPIMSDGSKECTGAHEVRWV